MADDLAAVLQISAASADAVIVGLAHRSVDGCCVREPVHTSAWVTGARFTSDAQGNDVVRITADTAIAGQVTTDLPLTDALREADDSLRDASQQLTDALGVTVTGQRYRIRPGGLLTLYALYDSPNPLHSVDAVSGSILSDQGVDYDFGGWLPAPVIKAYVDRLLGTISDDAIRVTGYSSEIGDRLKISVGGVTRGFRCNASISIKAEYVFVVGSGGKLGIQRVAWSWYIPKIQGWVAEHYYKDEVNAAIMAATDPANFFEPVAVRFGIPPTDSIVADVGTFQATAARLSTNGLRVWGNYLNQAPQPPQISVLPPGTITLVEEPDSACRSAAPAVYADSTLSIGNLTQRAKLYLCDIRLDGHSGFTIGSTTIPGARVAPDGRALTGLDGGGGSGSITVRYRGDRTAPHDGTLVVLANDPDHLETRIPLRTLPTGSASFRVDPPDTLEVRYYNTRAEDTTAVVATEDCRTGQVRQRPQNRQTPAATVTVYNTGDTALFICYLGVHDFSGVWDTLLLDRGPVLPGASIQIPVFFYPTSVGDDFYTNLDIGFQDGETYSVILHGRLDPQAQNAKAQSRTPSVDIDMVVDLVGDRLCMPNNGDICSARRFLEPAPAPGRPLGLVRVGPVPPSSKIILGGREGSIDVVDTSGTAVRDVVVEFPDPGGGAGPGGWNPCIARFDGIAADALAKVRMSVRGVVLSPAGDLVGKDVGGLAVDGDRLFVATKDRLITYGWDADGPKARGEVPGVQAARLATADGILVTAVGDELTLWRTGDKGVPDRRGTVGLPGQAAAIALTASAAWVLVGDRVLLVNTATAAVERVLPLPEPGALLATGAGMVAVGGEKHLFFFPVDRPDALQQLVLPGPAQHVHSDSRGTLVTGKFGTYEYRLGTKPQPLRYYRLPHWTSEFQPVGRDLVRLAGGRVQRWTATPHRIDRKRFKDAFALRYKPPRVTP